MLKISMFLHQNCPKISKVVLNVKAFKTLIKLTCLAEKFKAQPDHICLGFFLWTYRYLINYRLSNYIWIYDKSI